MATEDGNNNINSENAAKIQDSKPQHIPVAAVREKIVRKVNLKIIQFFI